MLEHKSWHLESYREMSDGDLIIMKCNLLEFWAHVSATKTVGSRWFKSLRYNCPSNSKCIRLNPRITEKAWLCQSPFYKYFSFIFFPFLFSSVSNKHEKATKGWNEFNVQNGKLQTSNHQAKPGLSDNWQPHELPQEFLFWLALLEHCLDRH